MQVYDIQCVVFIMQLFSASYIGTCRKRIIISYAILNFTSHVSLQANIIAVTRLFCIPQLKSVHLLLCTLVSRASYNSFDHIHSDYSDYKVANIRLNFTYFLKCYLID